MLVLRRAVGEEIVVTVGTGPGATEIVVAPTKVAKDGAHVYIGIDAPEDCPIHRREVHDEIIARAEDIARNSEEHHG